MKVNPVVIRTFIIRSQTEYSRDSQTINVRCILETTATGERQGFTDVEELLVVLRDELKASHNEIIPAEQAKEDKE